MPNEQEQFLKDLEPKETADVFEQPIVEPKEPEKQEPGGEDEDFEPKNRRERRLYRKFEQRGQEVEGLAKEVVNLRNVVESQQARQNTEEADFLKTVEKIYGTATPEAKEATETLKTALRGAYEAAKKEAREEARHDREEEQESESQAVAEEESTLDNMMAELEEEHDVDFSDPNIRKGFLNVLEKLSRKDKDGNIIEYADPEGAYEVYESRREKTTNRAKELASRSMTPSGQSQPSKLQEDAIWRQLKDQGIF